MAGINFDFLFVIQPEEQVKVIEAISSVLQALPPAEAIQPVLSITGPILSKLERCIEVAHQVSGCRVTAFDQQLNPSTIAFRPQKQLVP